MSFFDNIRRWFDNNFNSQPLLQSAQSYTSGSNFILAPLVLIVVLPIIAILGICGCIFGGRGSYSEPSYTLNTGSSWGNGIFNTPSYSSSYSTMNTRMPAQLPTTTPSYSSRISDPISLPTTSSSYGSSYSGMSAPISGPTTSSNVYSGGGSGQTAAMCF